MIKMMNVSDITFDMIIFPDVYDPRSRTLGDTRKSVVCGVVPCSGYIYQGIVGDKLYPYYFWVDEKTEILYGVSLDSFSTKDDVTELDSDIFELYCRGIDLYDVFSYLLLTRV